MPLIAPKQMECDGQIVAISHIVYRLLAFAVDCFILGFVAYFIHIVCLPWLGQFFSIQNWPMIQRVFGFPYLVIALGMGYNLMFEQSAFAATPGKIWMGIYVVNSLAKPLKFWQSLLRNASKVLLVFLMPFALAYFNNKSAPAEIISLLILVIFIILILSANEDAKNRMLYDFLAQSIVVTK